MENKNNDISTNNTESDKNLSQENTLDKSKFGALQALTAAQVVTLLIKSDSSFAGPCGY